eukprot:COSAG02_NODE_1105_length_14545_cov_15.280701_5_plen_111_part_00
MGTSIDWNPIGNREHGNMAELGNTLGTWEQFFRVGNMGTTRGLGTIGNISKSGILKLGTIGNSWEQLGKFSELNCKPLRISYILCVSPKGWVSGGTLKLNYLGYEKLQVC